MKTLNLFVTLTTLALLTPAAQAYQSGDWLIRSRGIYISPSATTDALNVDVKTNGTPEFDFSYFVAQDISLELILGMARHQVYLNHSSIGFVNVLPPTLTAQYHFKDLMNLSIDPYLGVGLNFTVLFNSNLPVDIDSTSFGPSFQAGLDVPLTGDTFINFDVKKVLMKTDLKVAGTQTKLDTLKINPWIFGIGLGVKL